MISPNVPLNPFSDQIVTQPRRAEPAIKGLNDQVLRRLITEIDKVNAVPRRCSRIQLVISPAGGYGKSHTTGRLFREVGRNATRVYVRPSAAPDSCWISLLHSLVQELTAPEFDGTTDQHQYPPTQLDALAHGVYGTLLVGLMDAGEYCYGDPEFVRHRLMKQAFEKWDLSCPESPWGAWASDMLDTFEKSETRSARLIRLLEELTQTTLSNTTRPQAWLRVLRGYCQDRADASTREFALEWIRARTPRDEVGTKPLGLVPSDGDDQSASVAVRNAAARTRVLDILALAKLFRPFILVFDQTEVFGRVPGMPKAFGSLLSDLVQGEGAHLTIVTANRDVWESQLLPAMEPADQDRIAPRLEMLGLTLEQARELAVQRLKQTQLAPDLVERVMAPEWLDEQFSKGHISTRDFLRRCECRFEDVVSAEPVAAPKPEMMLVELYSRAHQRIVEDRRELSDFRADVLRWALFEVPERVSTGVSAVPSKEDAPSIVGEWRNGDSKRWILALEEGSHALSWLSLTARAMKLHKDEEGTSVLAVRTSGQPPIPRPEWGTVGDEVEEVKNSGALSIVTLDADQLARIYAAWELYTQACQGDIPHEPDAVVRFAAQRFQSWYSALRSGRSGDAKVDGASESGESREPLLGPPPELSAAPSGPNPAGSTEPPATPKESTRVPASPAQPTIVPLPAPEVAPPPALAPAAALESAPSALPHSTPVLLLPPAPQLPPSPPPTVTQARPSIATMSVPRPRPYIPTPVFGKAANG